MKTAVISYSFTGNNEALAGQIAGELSAEHVRIKETKRRNTGSILLDVIFNKTPKAEPAPETLENYDLLLFVGPVWMGQAASPLRAYLERLKTNPTKYAFISLSGGAAGSNPKLADDLKKRAGSEPAALIDLHIADLLPPGPKPTMKDTSSYRIKDADLKKLTDKIVKTVRESVLARGVQAEK